MIIPANVRYFAANSSHAITKLGTDIPWQQTKKVTLWTIPCSFPSFREISLKIPVFPDYHRHHFLLLAPHVPNVAKRSIWEQCKKKYVLRTDRPTKKTSHLGKFEMAISRRGVVRSTSCLFYGGVFEVGGSNGANSGLTKFNRYVGENNARRLIRLVTI